MSKILHKLNVEHYAGMGNWIIIEEWVNDRGEMGIYQETSTEIGRESLYLFVLLGDTIRLIKTYNSCSPQVARLHAQQIADFSNAKKIPNTDESKTPPK